MNLKLTSELYKESKGTTDAKGALVGFQLPIGPGEIKASYARYRLEPAGALRKPTSTKLAIGYVHNLSKRTALYATIARISNSNGASQALSGAITAPNRASSGTEYGMENWGSIFEFADSVLTKPGDTPTLYSVTVVTHEVAHQWFGDLVTLDWWDNVWLNESFARWFDRRTTIKFHPDYYSFSDYVLDKHTVIAADLKDTAVPVQRNLNDAGSFGFISPSIFVYNKGSHEGLRLKVISL